MRTMNSTIGSLCVVCMSLLGTMNMLVTMAQHVWRKDTRSEQTKLIKLINSIAAIQVFVYVVKCITYHVCVLTIN